MDKNWSKTGQKLDQTELKPELKIGLKLDQNWTKFGQKLDQTTTKTGLNLSQNWSKSEL